MPAPVLQAQGAQPANATTGSVTPVLPAHAINDILVAVATVWLPNTVAAALEIPTPTGGWALLGTQMAHPATTNDGWHAVFWKRAASSAEANPVFTRATGWDSGTDTAYGARTFVIRGCSTTGNPWDSVAQAGPFTTANQSIAAVPVSGPERLVIHFYLSQAANAAGTITGWTAGTATTSTAGTDTGFQTFRKDNQAASTTAQASGVAAPTAGSYAFYGVSFRPPAPTTTGTARLSLGSGVTPATRTAHSLKVRARKTNAAHTATIRAQLYEGATARSAEYETTNLTTTIAEYTLALTDAEAAAITSYSDLEVRLRGYSSTGDLAVVEVAELRLEIPDSGVPVVDQGPVAYTSEASMLGAGVSSLKSPALSLTSESSALGKGVLIANSPALSLTSDGSMAGFGKNRMSSGAQALSGQSTYNGSGIIRMFSGSLALSGDGSMAGAGILRLAGSAAMSAESAMAGAGGFLISGGSLPMSGEGSMAGKGILSLMSGILALSGEGSMAGKGMLSHASGVLALSGDGSMVGFGVLRIFTAHPLTAESVMAGSGVLFHSSLLPLTAQSDFLGRGNLLHMAAFDLSAESSYLGSGALIFSLVSPLDGASSFEGFGVIFDPSETGLPPVLLEGLSTFTGAGAVIFNVSADLSSGADFAGSGTLSQVLTSVLFLADADFEGFGILDVAGIIEEEEPKVKRRVITIPYPIRNHRTIAVPQTARYVGNLYSGPYQGSHDEDE